jgi:hypothetical protein
VLGAVVLGCASSPLGFDALTSALATRDASAQVVVEWAPLWHPSVAGVLTWIGAAIAVALGAAAWRHRPQDPLLATSTAGAAALLLLGITAARFSPMALVAALPAVAAWASGIDWTAGRRRSRVAFLATGTAAGLLVALLLIAGLHLPDLGEPSPADFPTASTIESIPAGCRVLNEYDDGGYLLLLRHTDGVRVAMDGRNDVYGAALIAHLQSIISGRPGALAELRQNHVGCLLLDPDRPLIHQALAGGWKTAARDAHRTLLISPPSQPN